MARKNTKRFRLLPIVIFMAALMLTVRVGGLLWALAEVVTTRSVQTETLAGMGEAPLTVETAQASAQQPETAEAFFETYQAHAASDPLFQEELTFSQAELEVLQKLASRREALDAREREIEQRLAFLQAADAQIEQKIKRLKDLEGKIKKLIGTYDAQEQTKLDSLVKIYTNMKPKDAARIFNDLEMPILLTVFKKMKERTSAAVLSKMDPKKARSLTRSLVEVETSPFSSGMEE